MIVIKKRYYNKILFTNIKYYVGGGKTGKPLRLRRGQNIYINIGDNIDKYTDDQLKQLLLILYKSRFQYTKSTIIKRLYKNI